MSGGIKGVVMGAGRVNPPTRGHTILFRLIEENAHKLGCIPMFFIVDGEKSSQDKNKNPLTALQRLAIVRKLFPAIKFDIVSSAFEAVEVLDLQGLRPRMWVCGSDRASNYRKLLASEKLDGEVLEVDREAGEADGVSATAARKAALEGNMEEFIHHMPQDAKLEDLAQIAQSIREAINGGHTKL